MELAEELEGGGHLRWCVPADVEAALEAFDEAELEPYQPGDPAKIASAIDRVIFEERRR